MRLGLKIIITILISSPLICFLLFAFFGLKINYQSIDIILISILFIISLIQLRRNSPILYFLPFIFISLNLILGIYNPMKLNYSIFDQIGQTLKLSSPFVFLFLFKTKEGFQDMVKILKISCVLIAIINVSFFLLLITKNDELLLEYTRILGLYNYKDDLGTFFNRPVGYFFDYHSQILLPLCGLYLFNERNFKTLFFKALFISSILISGIKTGYAILAFLIIFNLINRISLSQKFKTLVLVISGLISLNFMLDNFVIRIINRIIIHDLEILVLHFTEIPKYLITDLPFIFLFGGQTFLENVIYSEVYLITLIFYFGVFRLFWFLSPFLKALLINNYRLQSISLIILLSLSHYYIYKNGVNIFASSFLISSTLLNSKVFKTWFQ